MSTCLQLRSPERPETDRRVRSPLTEAMLRPLVPEARWVKLRGSLAEAEYERVAKVRPVRSMWMRWAAVC